MDGSKHKVDLITRGGYLHEKYRVPPDLIGELLWAVTKNAVNGLEPVGAHPHRLKKNWCWHQILSIYRTAHPHRLKKPGAGTRFYLVTQPIRISSKNLVLAPNFIYL
jgi:hypothetical protein